MKRLVWFAISGGSGFVADAGLLALLIAYTPLGPYSARVLAIGFAMTVTWLINRTFTFGRSRHSLAVEGARYGSVAIAMALFNYAIYAGLLFIFPELPPVIAVAIASGIAMVFSYLGYARLVFGAAGAPASK